MAKNEITVDATVTAINELQQDVSNMKTRLDKAASVTYTKDRAAADRQAVLALSDQVEKLTKLLTTANSRIAALSTRIDNLHQETERSKFITAANEIRDELGLAPGTQVDVKLIHERMKLNASTKQARATMVVAEDDESLVF